ncbi:phosphoribosylanthranilate isomerase [Clostridium sp. AM27-31LB]|uniref:N-(5'-phosphoribosyl)anthranilate isomerase n=1 Tax=Butyribacter intestini TaxID=1703332 RepID=A0AAW3JQ59_9FIRM|nr:MULTISPECIES: phosphoribosylanthranilate isomerase [Clostridia]KQC84901.1 phosphoribosylanthranilate isomerase [Butyribacter intestini]RHT96013.1 phosphoribosylanthranilate isomerase [Clostridium sp. AM27-31LB]RHU74180.1 phosphoribosylanthranilate isomerase [Butyribacter intestini]
MKDNRAVLVKVCGLTDTVEADYLNKNKVDFAGFVLFFPKSKRNISIEKAEQIMAELDENIKKVAVIVSPDESEIQQINGSGFDYVQIHGEIKDRLLEQISKPVFKAFNIKDIKNIHKYQNNAKIVGYVFDAAVPGSGKVFDWSILNDIKRDAKTFILAGGLNDSNVREAVKLVNPDVVDVSSGVEYDSGSGKDPEKIKQFIRQLEINNKI